LALGELHGVYSQVSESHSLRHCEKIVAAAKPKRVNGVSVTIITYRNAAAAG
jgi:hypothetical protein